MCDKTFTFVWSSDLYPNVSLDTVLSKSRCWLSTNYYWVGGEYHYKHIKRSVIIEELVFDEVSPTDFKFFVVNGKCNVVQIDIDRSQNHSRFFTTPSGERLSYSLHYPFYKGPFNMPATFQKAVQIAEKLAVLSDFVRVDLYLNDEKVVFGELTVIPGNNLERFTGFNSDLNHFDCSRDFLRVLLDAK